MALLKERSARHANGEELPTYVEHCQAHVLKSGELGGLTRGLTVKPKQMPRSLW